MMSWRVFVIFLDQLFSYKQFAKKLFYSPLFSIDITIFHF